MDFLYEILTISLISIAVPAAFGVIWFFKIRGEKKIVNKEVVRTRPPIIVTGFFLGVGILILFGGVAAVIYFCITDAENTTIGMVILATVGIAAFSGLSFFGYAYVRFNYVIADKEGIFAGRLFRKTKFYHYEEIGYFNDTISLRALGGLIGYDKNGKKIFAIEALHIGASAVAKMLRDHGVQEKRNQI